MLDRFAALAHLFRVLIEPPPLDLLQEMFVFSTATRRSQRHRHLAAYSLEQLRRIRQDHATRNLAIGYFGASTGAGAALVAAARARFPVGAVVSRGGRPDLAGTALGEVRAPTLLIVGGLDHEVLALNRSALKQLRCEKDLQVVPGATHLFEERGTLDQVIALARRWFCDHLGGQEQAR